MKKIMVLTIVVMLLMAGQVFALSPNFTIHPGTNLEVGEEVLFNAEGTTESTYPQFLIGSVYEWDFGDGTYMKYGYPLAYHTFSGIATTHFFMKPGTFTVKLTVKLYHLYKSHHLERTLPLQLLDEKTTTMVVTVSGEAPIAGFSFQRAPFRARLAQFIRVLIPAENLSNRLIVTLTGDNGYSSTLLDKTSLQRVEKFLLEQRNIPKGNYRLVAELKNSSGQHISQWVEKFSKTYNGIPHFGINEWNAPCIDGTPKFFVTPYLTRPENIANFIQRGFVNSLHTIGFYPIQNPAAWLNFLSLAKNSNCMVFGPGRGNYDTSINKRFTRNIKLSEINHYVNASKSNSQIAMWHWKDEPNNEGRDAKTPPSVLSAWSYSNHQIDPTRGTGVNMYGFGYLPHYGTAGNEYDYINSAVHYGGKQSFFADMLNMDDYPLAFRNHLSYDKPDRGVIDLWVESIDNFKARNLDLIPLSVFTEVCQNELGKTIPSSEQVLMENWLAVVHGMKAVNYFDLFVYSTIRYDAGKKFTDAMNYFGEIILEPDVANPVTDNSNVRNNRVDTLTKNSGGDIYLFAIRLTEPTPLSYEEQIFEPETITTIFDVPGMQTGTIESLDENGNVLETLSLNNGHFTDTFEKHTIRIYRISNGSGNVQPPTELKIEKQ